MNSPIIKIENVSKKYVLGTRELYYSLRDQLSGIFKKKPPKKEFWALYDVSFDVTEGETIGIIGRNGAGKSTLLKILSRITPPTRGKIIMRGRVASLLEVGTGFNPELTGRENIYLNGAILGMTKKEIERKFDEIVAFSEIEQFLDTPVKHYSSGMYVRLAFAIAAHLEPEILIVDEVLAVGDQQFQKKCLGKMDEVARSGRTILFVSHNMGAISNLCGRSVLLSQGRVMFVGKSSEAIANYINEFEGDKGWVNLKDWVKGRSGSGKVRFTSLLTRNDRGKIKSKFCYLEPIIFEFEIAGKPDPLCLIGISVRDSQGNVVLHLNNDDDKFTIPSNKEKNKIAVCLSDNLLNEGLYHITLWLGNQKNVLYDRLENCLSFVIDSSAFGGKIRSQGLFRVKSKWSVENC